MLRQPESLWKTDGHADRISELTDLQVLFYMLRFSETPSNVTGFGHIDNIKGPKIEFIGIICIFGQRFLSVYLLFSPLWNIGHSHSCFSFIIITNKHKYL